MPTSTTPRARTARALLALGPVVLVVATAAAWLRFDVLPPAAVSHDVRATLRAPEVRAELADRIADAIAREDTRLLAVEPVLRTVADAVIESRPFADVVEIAVQQTRRAVLQGREADATRLQDIEEQFVSVVEALDPSLAERVPRSWDTRIVDLRSDSAMARSLRWGDRLATRWGLAASVAAATYLGAVLLARDRRRAVGLAAAGVLLVGVAMVLARAALGAAVEGAFEDPGVAAAAHSTFDVVTEGWRRIGVGYAVSGAVVLGAAVPVGLPAQAPAAAAALARRLGPVPASPAGQGAWGLAVLGAGAALVWSAPAIGRAVVTAGGLALAFVGARALVGALPNAPRAEHPGPARAAVAVGAAVAAVAVPATVWASVRGGEERATALRCNGHVELCDRRLDEVVLAGTHNAMAAVDSGFLLAEQRGSMEAQLEAGVRTLLVDTLYGLPTTTNTVWTDVRSIERDDLVADLGESTVESIERLREALLPASGPPGVYLCHAYCELGATPALDGFGVVRRFLETHPSEVVVLVVQDETDAADTVASLRAADLERFAWAPEPRQPVPTLGDLVRAGTPLVVLAESHGGAPAWFQPAFQVLQDTTYRARTPEQLTCDRNRGPGDAPLFLLNHWVDAAPPDPGQAAVVNAESFLVDRARRCAEDRGRPVNIVAVNFWQTGDLLHAVDLLNGVADDG